MKRDGEKEGGGSVTIKSAVLRAKNWALIRVSSQLGPRGQWL